MTSSTPTYQDYQYILDNHRNRFGDPMSALHTLRQMPSDDGYDDERLADLAQNYEMGGNPPLAEAPVYPEADPDGDGVFDPTFAAVCTTCQPGQPCCMKTGSVSDKADASRKILWPPANGQTKMLTVAKDMEGANLVSKVKVDWQGTECKVGHPDRPKIQTRGTTLGNLNFTDKTKEMSIGEQPPMFLAIGLKDFISDEVIAALLVFDLFMAMRSPETDLPSATFSPYQCVTDAPTAASLKVIAVPHVKLEGNLDLATRISFTTGGVSGGASATGSLTGEYGNLKFEAKGNKSANLGSGVVKEEANTDGPAAKGLVGLLSRVAGAMDKYVSEGNTKDPKPRTYDLSQFTSGVTLTKKLSFNVGAFTLQGKKDTPDLEVGIGTLTSQLEIGVTGRIDFIDILARVYTGPGGDVIARTRAAMASGTHVRATLDAFLEVGATGSLTHNINSGATIAIPANGDASLDFDCISQTFGGELKIRGLAKLGIKIEAEVWVFKAEAGASGSVHTSWSWQMRQHEGRREKRYIFEGVVATLEMKARGSIDMNSNGVSQNVLNFGGGFKYQENVADIFDQVSRGLTESQNEATRIENTPVTQEQGQRFSLIRPEQTEWEDY